MANQVTSAVLLAACFAVLIMVCAAVGEGQRAVPLSKQGMRPLHKEMKVVKGLKGVTGMRPTLKNMKVTKGMRPIPTKEMPPMPPIAKPAKEMPPMPPIAKVAKEMPPIAKNMKITIKGMRPVPKLVVKGMPPMADMPPMPGMPPMPDGTSMTPPYPNSSSFTYPSSLVVGFLALVVAFFLA